MGGVVSFAAYMHRMRAPLYTYSESHAHTELHMHLKTFSNQKAKKHVLTAGAVVLLCCVAACAAAASDLSC